LSHIYNWNKFFPTLNIHFESLWRFFFQKSFNLFWIFFQVSLRLDRNKFNWSLCETKLNVDKSNDSHTKIEFTKKEFKIQTRDILSWENIFVNCDSFHRFCITSKQSDFSKIIFLFSFLKCRSNQPLLPQSENFQNSWSASLREKNWKSAQTDCPSHLRNE